MIILQSKHMQTQIFLIKMIKIKVTDLNQSLTWLKETFRRY